MIMIKSFLTEFDGSMHSNKIKEEGVEHEWTDNEDNVYKTYNWKTDYLA